MIPTWISHSNRLDRHVKRLDLLKSFDYDDRRERNTLGRKSRYSHSRGNCRRFICVIRIGYSILLRNAHEDELAPQSIAVFARRSVSLICNHARVPDQSNRIASKAVIIHGSSWDRRRVSIYPSEKSDDCLVSGKRFRGSSASILPRESPSNGYLIIRQKRKGSIDSVEAVIS